MKIFLGNIVFSIIVIYSAN